MQQTRLFRYASITIMSTTALAVSTGFMAICCGLACIGRQLASKLLKPGLVQELFYEAIASAEMCAICFELIIGKYVKV